jgi:DNA-binding response OmpR family regulator
MGPTPALAESRTQVLVVEDDPGIATQLLRCLNRGGYVAEHVMTGQDALSWGEPDVMLLDLGLPDMDGVEVCRRLRERSGMAIIVVTARGEEPERVLALDAGADDYLVKPFGLSELLARIRAVRRRTRQGSEVLRHGPLAVDLRAGRVQAHPPGSPQSSAVGPPPPSCGVSPRASTRSTSSSTSSPTRPPVVQSAQRIPMKLPMPV